MGEKSRIDIKRRNVFISWTGRDADLKDKIVERLESGKLACTVSDGKSTADAGCSGNFEEWSINAAKSANIFLLILTENTLQSVYVPVEIKEALTLDDADNRFIVVCKSVAFWRKATFVYGNDATKGLAEHKISVIEMPDDVLTAEKLDEIYNKTCDLVNNRADYVYRAETEQETINLPSLYNQDIADRKFGYDRLYVQRHVTERDENGRVVASHYSPSDIVQSGDVFYIYGPAGSGKTQYIHQLRQCAGDNSVVISLSCSTVASSTLTLYDQMYEEFCRVISQENYYSKDNFNALVSVRHVVLVLDGLDEIATQGGVTRFLDKVEQFYQPNRHRVTMFFTGRDEKSANRIVFSDKSVRRLQLDKLSEDEIQELGNNLFLAFDAGEQSKAFYVSVKDLSDEIRTNPLLLSQLAIIYKHEGKVPETVVGIFDAISEITLRVDDSKRYVDFPDSYKDMLVNIGGLLKHFAHKRYVYQSQGKLLSPLEIFMEILRTQYPLDFKNRAEHLMEYLLKRVILVKKGEEFYHKMFMEYFTAVYYFENSCMSDCIFDYDTFGELFSHYSEPYWSQVIQLFLVKADSNINDGTTYALYSEIIKAGKVSDYTLLLDACRDLVVHKDEAQVALVADILYKSATNVYPPYGPLFWYVPAYNLYEQLFLALEKLEQRGEVFAKAAALARDVCYIYGQKHNVGDFTQKVDGKAIFAEALPHLTGVRRALCEIFYLGENNYANCGADIYPRCFNVAETLSMRDNNCGIGGKMPTPFNDELGLYCHESYNELNGEYIGFISCPYDKEKVGRILRSKYTYKVTGMAYSQTKQDSFDLPQFNSKALQMVYYPENICKLRHHYNSDNAVLRFLLDCGVGERDIVYLKGKVRFPAPNDCVFDHCLSLTDVEIADGTKNITCGAFECCENLVHVSLPSSVTYIGKNAFRCCPLSTISLPCSVKIIDDSAFEKCCKLTMVVVPQGVERIGRLAFAECEALSYARLSNSVTFVGEGAFWKCGQLENVYLSARLTSIERFLFGYCTRLNSPDIPNSVTAIRFGAFYNCKFLVRITIPDSVLCLGDDEQYKQQYSELYGAPYPEDDAIYGVFEGCSNLQLVHLPQGITTIYHQTFKNCCYLNRIEIPNGVTYIESEAFSYCKRLTAISLPHGLKKLGYGAFYFCSALTILDLPDSITELGSSAFSGCGKLATIYLPARLKYVKSHVFSGCPIDDYFRLPSYVEQIDSYAFSDCEWLKHFNIPDGVVRLGDNVFDGCSRLLSVYVPDSVVEIGKNLFKNCPSLVHVRLPFRFNTPHFLSNFTHGCQIEWGERTDEAVTIVDGVTALTSDMIQKDVVRVVIPSSVKIIADGAFANCRLLETVSMASGVQVIGNYAFANCVSLKDVSIPDTVTQIGDRAFFQCENIEEIILPDSVTSLGASAFSLCTRLYNARISNCLTEIKGGTFAATSLHQVTIPESVKVISSIDSCEGEQTVGAFAGCSYLKTVTLSFGLEVIGDKAFGQCEKLSEISLPDSVHTVGGGAFAGCKGLRKVKLSQRLSEINDCAFCSCESLDSISIPASVTAIKNSAFARCSNLKEVSLPDGLEQILSCAFSESGLTSVTLPSSLKLVQKGAFYNCLQLSSVTFSDGGELQLGVSSKKAKSHVDSTTFWGDEDELFSLSEIDDLLVEFGVFQGCQSLKEIVLPQGIAYLGEETFQDCTGLEFVYIPDGLINLRYSIFDGCSKLTNVRLPSTLKVIGYGVFNECKALVGLDIPDGVEEISDYAFYECSSLQSVTLPRSVFRVGEQAFARCYNLKTIDVSLVYEIGDKALDGCICLENVTIGRNFTNDVDRIFGRIKPNKINFI